MLNIRYLRVRASRICTGLAILVVTAHCNTGATGFVNGSVSAGAEQNTTSTGNTTGATTAGGGAGPAGQPGAGSPQNANVIGLRLQPAGVAANAHGLTDPYWPATIGTLAQLVPGSTAAATLVVGTNSHGSCVLAMPNSGTVSTSDTAIQFDSAYSFETLLGALDAVGAQVVLEVQPGTASLQDLASVVMSHFSSHKSVVGFGIDVQYYNVNGFSNNATLSNEDATTVVGIVKSINNDYQVYVKAATAGNLPDNSVSGLVFVSDQSGFESQARMVQSLQAWAAAFAPAPVQFDIGAVTDMSWWCTTPVESMAQGLMNAARVPGATNVSGLYWQGDGIVSVYPTPTCTPTGTQTVGTVSAGTQTAGTVTAGTQTAGTATAGTQTAGTATAGTQTAGTVTAGTQTAGIATAGTQTAGTVTAGTQTAGTVTAGTQTAGSVTAGTQTAGTVTAGTQTAGTVSAGAQTAGTVLGHTAAP